MGAQFSQLVVESSRDKEGEEFFVENQKVSSKELPILAEGLARQLPNLYSLDVRSCRLKLVPPSISKLTSLQILRLEENKITTLPTVELACMKSLRELSLARNQLLRFPVESLKFLENLQILVFSNNLLSVLPALDNLASLRHLQLDSNDFSTLPPQLCDLPSLRILNLNSNKICIVPDHISRLTSLEELHLRHNLIKTFPTQIGRLVGLKLLDVAENELSNLPDETRGLVSLKTLLCQHNNFSEIPTVVFGLPCLSMLRFNDNKISSLPAEIKNASRLTELHLEENELTSLPVEICLLSSLRKMYLEFNRLEHLPDNIGNLKLNVLLLHSNKIKSIPQTLLELKTLVRFAIDDNLLDESSLSIVKKEGALGLLNINEAGRSRGNRKSRRLSRTFRRSVLGLSLRDDITREVLLGSPKEPLPVISVSPTPSAKIATRTLSRRLTMEKIKSTEDLISPRRGHKKLEKRADIPPLERFKEFFRQFVEQQDYSKKRKEVLKKATAEFKWQLLSQYKESTLELIRNSGGSFKEAGGSAIKSRMKERSYQEYITLIKERPNKTDLTHLRNLLINHKPDHVWTSFFIDMGGITSVSHLLTSLLSRGMKANQLIVESLKLVQTLLDICLKTVLTTNEIIDNVGLHFNNSHLEIRRLVIEIMIQICQEHAVGVSLVMDAITNSALSQNMHSMYRFDPLVQPLQDDSSLIGLDSSSNDLRSLSLTLINTIIDLIEDLEIRFEIRAEFLRLGIQDHLDRLKNSSHSDLIYQVRSFETSGKEDYEDMLGRFDRNTILKKMSGTLSTDMSKYSIGKNMLRVSIFLLGTQNHFSMQFNQHTTVDEVIRNIWLKFSLPLSNEDFGLFVPISDTNPNRISYLPANVTGMWLREYVAIDSYGLSSELLSEMELKLKPWRINVEITGKPSKELIDPNCSCAAITKAIMEANGAGPYSEEFGLFMNFLTEENYAKDELRKLLDDSKCLSDYYLNLTKKGTGKNCEYNNTLEVRLKPRPFKVRMVDNSTQVFDLELSSLIQDIFAEISTKIGISSINSNDYGLRLINPHRQEDIWLKNDNSLGDYFIDEESEIRISLRPRILTILHAETGEEVSEFFDLSAPLIDLLPIISDYFTKNPGFNIADYCVSLITEGAERVLNNNQSLRSQGVSANSYLMFKKRTHVEDSDVNIWSEVENSSNISLSEQEGGKKMIESATFNILVQRLTSLDEIADTTTRFMFMMTYRLFSTPNQLLEKLVQRYNIPPSHEHVRGHVQMRVGIFLKQWVEYEDPSQDIKAAIMKFLEQLNTDGYTAIYNSIQKTISAREDNSQHSPILSPHSSTPMSPHRPQILNLSSVDEVELAHRLSLRAYEVYRKIEATELFGQAWSKPHLKHLAPNILAMIDYFNEVSLWVASSILSEKLIKARTNAVSKLIKTAYVLRDIKNYHLLQAFISGMNLSAILRLKWTFARLPKRYKTMLKDLEKEMSVEGSYKLYRAAIQKVQSTSCIPYLGMHLQDLIFIEEGNPDHIHNRINFGKFRLIYEVVSSLQKFQTISFHFESESAHIPFCPLEYLDERALYEKSLQCEPRGAESNDIL